VYCIFSHLSISYLDDVDDVVDAVVGVMMRGGSID
jgi:hypothetical protein